MVLDGVLTTAASGLDSITRRLAVVSQNVANAGTPDYVRQSLAVASAVSGGLGIGVRTGIATRSLDQVLQADVFAAGASATGDRTRQAALEGIDAASGTVASGQDLPGLLGALRDGFSALAGDPSNQTQQRQVVNQAGTLARGVNALGQAVQTARQSAQDSLVADVTTANTALRALGALSDQVIQATARGESTADLEDQRDVQLRTVSELTGARFLRQSNGDLLAVSGGTVLPLRAAKGPFALADAALAPDTPAAAVPALTVSGAGVATLGGRIGANLDLRDTILPGLQAGLDGFAQALASGFQAHGLTLFTDPAGAVPGAVQAGFAQTIRVADAVVSTPSIVRDGAGPAGAAGDTTLIDRVLGQVLSGGAGSLSASATGLAAGHASLAADAAARAGAEQAIQTSLQTKLAAGTGVSVDSELADMVRLQNAYGANAKVIAATQAMWTQLLDSVR